MLYQPTNLIPSSFSGEGNDVINAAEENTFSALMTGSSGMVNAYRLIIMKNDTSSTVVYDTDAVELDEPFCPTTYDGHQIRFEVEIPANSDPSNGMRNEYENGYKWTLTVWEDYDESDPDAGAVTSQENFFWAKTGSSITIVPSTAPATITSRENLWKAEYVSPSSIRWFQWTLAEVKNGQYITVHQTTRIYGSPQVWFKYAGLVSGRTYAVRVHVVNQYGQSIESDWAVSAVSYDTVAVDGATSINQINDGVRSDWSGVQYIEGEALYKADDSPSDHYEIRENDPDEGRNSLDVESDTYVNFESSPTFTMEMSEEGTIVWCGYPHAYEGASTDILEFLDENNTSVRVLRHEGFEPGLMPGQETEIPVSGISDKTKKTPYVIRSAMDTGADGVYNTEYGDIVGGTLVWNQLAQNNAGSASYCGKSLDDTTGIITVTPSGAWTTKGTVGVYGIVSAANLTVSHKYYLSVSVKPDYVGTFRFGWNGNIYFQNLPADTWTRLELYIDRASNYSSNTLALYLDANSSGWTSGTYQYKEAVCIDVSAALGSNIADYVYSLETDVAGSGINWFHRYFNKHYYAYDPGSLQSVNTSAHKTVGFNQWDEVWEEGSISQSTGNNAPDSSNIRSKNYIPVVPLETYYFKASSTMGIRLYDSNKVYLGSRAISSGAFNRKITMENNVRYIRFTLVDTTSYDPSVNPVCINIANDNSRNGEYEPYISHNYVLDSTLTLRGIPKLDSNNNLYYDGDVYNSDGTVERRYAQLDSVSGSIGDTITLTGIDASATDIISSAGHLTEIGTLSGSTLTLTAALSGASIVYPLATATEESADSYTNPQIMDSWGTEEYIDAAEASSTRDVAIPVGHDSDYTYSIGLTPYVPLVPNDGQGGHYTYIVSGHTYTQDTHHAPFYWYVVEMTKDGLYVKEFGKVLKSIGPLPVVQVTDARAMPADGVIVDIPIAQDLRGQPYPYPAGAGKNRFDVDNAEFVNGKVIAADGSEDSNTRYRYTGSYTPVTASTEYSLSYNKTAGVSASGLVCEYDSSKAFLQRTSVISLTSSTGIQSGAFTTGENTAYVRLCLPYASGATDQGASDIQVELGPVATSYAPYSNICPFSGWTGATLSRSGANIFNIAHVEKAGSGVTVVIDGSSFVVTASAGYTNQGFKSDPFWLKSNVIYTLKAHIKRMSGPDSRSPTLGFRWTSPASFISGGTSSLSSGVIEGDVSKTIAFTPNKADRKAYISGLLSPSTALDYENVGEYRDIQLFIGEPTSEEYVEFTGFDEYPFDWSSSAGTIYGGKLDVTNGLLTVTHGQIASYNGEYLPGAWLSDRDAYAAGTTPTIGAQVVYELKAPILYQLTPQQVVMLNGANNLFSSAGDVTLVYFASGQ